MNNLFDWLKVIPLLFLGGILALADRRDPYELQEYYDGAHPDPAKATFPH